MRELSVGRTGSKNPRPQVLGRVCWSWVVGCGSWVVGRGSQVVGRGFQVVGRGLWIVGY